MEKDENQALVEIFVSMVEDTKIPWKGVHMLISKGYAKAYYLVTYLGLRPACGEHPPTPRIQNDCAV